MTNWQTVAARRNAAVLGASAAAIGMLFLYPTSTNHGSGHHRPGQALAPAGVVLPKSTASTGTAGSTASAVKVINGTSAGTRFGPVQVQLKVRGGRIVSARAIDYPQGSGFDRQINSYAIPLLEQETVAAQSAQIDTVSGATYTTDGYVRSLQAALDAAHL